MVIRECFNVSGGNSGLTERVIYLNPPEDKSSSIMVYSGATLDTTQLGVIDQNTIIYGKSIKIFKAPAIIVVRKGLAGKTRFIENGRFTINDDAYVVTVKEKYAEKINIEWAEKELHRYANVCVSSKGTNGTFSKEQFLDLEFSYPSMKEQEEIIYTYKKISSTKGKLYALKEHVEKLESYTICGKIVFQKEAGKLFDMRGGNSGLTEEFIYQNQPENANEAVAVLSSSTDVSTSMGMVSSRAQIKGENIKCFKGPALVIARNGQAGKGIFIKKGVFTINDHAYVLTVKPAYKEQIELEWFANVSQQYTKNCVTSKDSNGTFCKELFLKEKIDVIDHDTQKMIIKENVGMLHSRIDKCIKIFEGKE